MPLEVLIDNKTGAVTMKPAGYPGGECRRVTELYSRNLAGEATKDETTDEACAPERNYMAVASPGELASS